MRKTALSLAAAVALGTLGLTAAAEAMPVGSGAPVVEKQANANIETVAHRRYWRHGGRHHWRHHGGDGWGYGGAFLGGVLLGSALDNRYYDDDDDYYYAPRRYRHRVSDDHVDYCLDRYRSYDVRSDTFMGYDGYRHRCNSPYD
ncbi:MAG: BA14K family protein [Parvibaculaceae bacterium]|jgi:hypothetical protein